MNTIQALSRALIARENCARFGNSTWYEKWDARITKIMDCAPSGSGFDNGTRLVEDRCTDRKLVFDTAFHHINATGMCDGWTERRVTVHSTLEGLHVRVEGRDRNHIKDYIGDMFYEWLTEPYIEEFK
jgi:hypothetical protein